VLRRLTPWLALLGLATATTLLWQARFAAVDHPLNGDAGFKAGLDGWSKSGGKNGLRQENGATVARFARPARDGEFNSATRWSGPLGELHYLHVEVDASWNNLVVSGVDRAGPRLVLMSRNPENRTRYSGDNWVYVAKGTRDWHHEEAVFKVEPGTNEIGLAFQMIGRQGRMEVRNLRITALRDRPWVPAATALLLIGWTTWLAGRLRGRKQPSSWWRGVPAALLIVVASWYLVFPVPGKECRPLIGSFLTGATEPPPTLAVESPQQAIAAETRSEEAPGATPPETDPAAATSTPRQPRVRVIPPGNTTGQPAPAKPKNSTAPSPQPPVTKPALPAKPHGQRSASFSIRNLDLKLDLLHILPFLGLSLGVFLILGTLRPWLLLSAVALLSEIMPNWLGRWTGADDLLDLAANLAGVALGAGAWVLIRHLVKNLPRRRQT